MWEITSTWRGSDRCTHITIDTPAGEVELYRTEDSRDAALFKAQLLMWQGVCNKPPEAQKVQDADRFFPSYRLLKEEIRSIQSQARIQAIKDVARFLRMREISAYITGYHMKALENGKIPE